MSSSIEKALQVDPATLKVSDIKKYIVLLGAMPGKKSTKAMLIGEFMAAREAYMKGSHKHGLLDSVDLEDFIEMEPADGKGMAIDHVVENIPAAHPGKGELTQSAFDFTNMVDNTTILRQLHADKSMYKDKATPIKPLKNPYGVERTPATELARTQPGKAPDRSHAALGKSAPGPAAVPKNLLSVSTIHAPDDSTATGATASLAETLGISRTEDTTLGPSVATADDSVLRAMQSFDTTLMQMAEPKPQPRLERLERLEKARPSALSRSAERNPTLAPRKQPSGPHRTAPRMSHGAKAASNKVHFSRPKKVTRRPHVTLKRVHATERGRALKRCTAAFGLCTIVGMVLMEIYTPKRISSALLSSAASALRILLHL